MERSPNAYMHNGYFKSLTGLVHFYNARDVKPVGSGSLTEREAHEIGNLGLSQAEERAIVAFLGTLSDGYAPADGRR